MNITSFLIYCIIVTFTPGPTNIVILSAAQNFGTKKTMEYVYGATIGFGLLLATSALLNLLGVVTKTHHLCKCESKIVDVNCQGVNALAFLNIE